MSFDHLVSRTLHREVALLQSPLQLLHGEQVVHQLPHWTPHWGRGSATDMWISLVIAR